MEVSMYTSKRPVDIPTKSTLESHRQSESLTPAKSSHSPPTLRQRTLFGEFAEPSTPTPNRGRKRKAVKEISNQKQKVKRPLSHSPSSIASPIPLKTPSKTPFGSKASNPIPIPGPSSSKSSIMPRTQADIALNDQSQSDEGETQFEGTPSNTDSQDTSKRNSKGRTARKVLWTVLNLRPGETM